MGLHFFLRFPPDYACSLCVSCKGPGCKIWKSNFFCDWNLLFNTQDFNPKTTWLRDEEEIRCTALLYSYTDLLAYSYYSQDSVNTRQKAPDQAQWSEDILDTSINSANSQWQKCFSMNTKDKTLTVTWSGTLWESKGRSLFLTD